MPLEPDQILDMWQETYGPLSKTMRERFLGKAEVQELCDLPPKHVLSAIDTNKKLKDAVVVAQRLTAASAERERHNPQPARGRQPVTRPSQATKSAPGPTTSAKRASKKTREPSSKAGKGESASVGGIAHMASGFSGKPRSTPLEADLRERCSGCGALIDPASAALHDCPY